MARARRRGALSRRSARHVRAGRGHDVLLRRLDHFKLELGPGGRDADYPLPSVMRLRGEGVEGEIQLSTELVRHDPFEALPRVFRLLLSLRIRPLRVWVNSPYEVRIEVGPDRRVLELRGSGITSATYLNPVPPPTKAKQFAPSAGV